MFALLYLAGFEGRLRGGKRKEEREGRQEKEKKGNGQKGWEFPPPPAKINI